MADPPPPDSQPSPAQQQLDQAMAKAQKQVAPERKWSLPPGDPGSKWTPKAVITMIMMLGGPTGVSTMFGFHTSHQNDLILQRLDRMEERLNVGRSRLKLLRNQVDVERQNQRIADGVRDERDEKLARTLSRMNGRAFMVNAPIPNGEFEQDVKPKLMTQGHHAGQIWPAIPLPQPLPAELPLDEDERPKD